MKVFVDTSALVAVLDAGDAQHDDAKRLFARLGSNADVVTHNYLHAEAIAVVRRALGIDAMHTLIDDLLPALRTIWVDEILHRSALAAVRSAGSSASFCDQVSFAVMRAEGIKVAFAYDADFEKQGFGHPTAPREPDRPKRLSEDPAPYASSIEGDADLVGVAEIAARSGRSTNTVQSWRRRHRDFPAPVADLAAAPVWTWTDVAGWINARGGGARS